MEMNARQQHIHEQLEDISSSVLSVAIIVAHLLDLLLREHHRSVEDRCCPEKKVIWAKPSVSIVLKS